MISACIWSQNKFVLLFRHRLDRDSSFIHREPSLPKISKKDNDFLPDFVQDALSKASFYGCHQLQSDPEAVLLNFTFLVDGWLQEGIKGRSAFMQLLFPTKDLAFSKKGS